MIDQPTLFDTPLVGYERECGRCGQPFETGEQIVVASRDLGAVHPYDCIGPVRMPEPKRARAQKLPLSEKDRERKAAIEELKGILRPLLLARALERRDRDLIPGVTADDVEELLDQQPKAALLGSQQRSRSWIGPWLSGLARAQLLRPFLLAPGQPVKRNSLDRRRRNRHVVYLHPLDRRAV